MSSRPPASRFDTLWLWFLGLPSTPQLIGELKYLTLGKGVSLTYAQSWLKEGFRISEDLPLLDSEFFPRSPGRAVGAVDDARPDRWGERVIQFVDRPSRLSVMEYLYYAGDDRFGALGVSTSREEYLPRRSGPMPRIAQAQAMSEVMRKIGGKEPLNEMERQIASAGGSLGGAKPKAVISIDGAEWVIKFFAGEPVDVPLIEHASMTLAAKAGINVAKTRLIRLHGENAIGVCRFDRTAQGRVHTLSAGTVLRAASPESPDLGYPALAQALRRYGETAQAVSTAQMSEVFRRMVFNILIDNTDDHEKNHSLMYVPASPAGKLQLAPAYDILPTNSGQGHQEFNVGSDGRDSTLTNAMSQCALFGMERHAAAQVVLEIIAIVDTWQEHFARSGVSASDIDNLADRIDGSELFGQRRRFDSAAYASPAPRRPRRPF
ncbi:MAG: HipA domain-containing protein [Steroidobacteraceae bacterium]